MKKTALLLCLSLMACGVFPRDAEDAVTEVTVVGPMFLAVQASTRLVAVVEGTGSFSPEVTWSIESGGGALSATTGQVVTYTAPPVNNGTTVTIHAVSQADAAKVGTLTLTLTTPPAPSRALAASYTGTQNSVSQTGEQNGRYTPPRELTETTQQMTYRLDWEDDDHLRLFGVRGFSRGIPVNVHPDGALSIPDVIGDATQTNTTSTSYSTGMGAAPGGGTWDDKGNLTLTWSSVFMKRTFFLGSTYPPIYQGVYLDNHFTAVRVPGVPEP